ncbi:hypothetical protein ACWIDW_04860 [Microbacterium sp. NPDC055312]
MRADDFYNRSSDTDPWGSAATPQLNEPLLQQAASGPLGETSDVELAAALAHFVHSEFELYGTSGSSLSRDDSALMATTLTRVLQRLGISDFSLPFRDFEGFRSYWLRNDGYGSWQARRDILNGLFDPLHEQLERREAATLEWTLASGISPHPVVGWPRVDEEISEMRRHFNMASTQQDYSNIGNDCIAVLEALSAVVYDHDRHGSAGEEEPSVARTKARFDRYIEVELPGPESSHLRKLARAAVELAQAVKHRRETATRTEAGIAADSVILLANMLRRLQG